MDYGRNIGMGDYKVSESLGHIVNRVSIIMRRNLTLMLKEQGIDLTPEEFAILHTLWEADGLFQTEITEKTLKDKTRVTRLLGRLTEKSFVEKKTDEKDRRNFRVFLTAKGSNLRHKVLPIVRILMDQALCQVSTSDFETTARTLKKIFANLNNSILSEPEGTVKDDAGGVE